MTIYKNWKRNDCIALIQFIQNCQKQAKKSNVMAIMNVYARETQRLKNDKTELYDMYNELCTLLQEVQKISNTISIYAKMGKSNQSIIQNHNQRKMQA